MTIAKDFVLFMEKVWSPDEDAPPYEEHHHARLEARAWGGTQLWAYQVHREPGFMYEFPDQSRVWVATHGGAAMQTKRNKGGIRI